LAQPFDCDLTDTLAEAVREAAATRTPLRVVGGDSKRFYGRPVEARTLAVGGHRGIVRYDPAELVITARCGTPLAEIEAMLAQHGQCLPFEPPAYGDTATLGGTIAAGLAGPARVARGPVRDHVLGARLLTGDGRVLRFGGEVMKNVAGYDVSRLLVGSLGILGVMLDVSIKVLPRPPAALTVQSPTTPRDALGRVQALSRRGLPLTASFWCDGMLNLRFEAAPASLEAIADSLGGTRMPASDARAFWVEVREQRHAYFNRAAGPLWRYWVPATSEPSRWPLDRLAFEWHGAQRWVVGEPCDAAADVPRGVKTLFRPLATPPGTDEVFAPLAPSLLPLHRAIKAAFDPQGILNPGRMYREL
jgi:glycolate oxidase FAD binding subunit